MGAISPGLPDHHKEGQQQEMVGQEMLGDDWGPFPKESTSEAGAPNNGSPPDDNER